MRVFFFLVTLLSAVTAFAQVPCLDPLACNFNTMEECVYVDAEGEPCVVQGCTNALACNYDAEADVDDGSCEFTSCLGCVDAAACNFDPTALYSDGSCLFTVDCNGVCGGTWVQDTCGFCYDPLIGTDGLDSLVVLEWTEAPEAVMVPLGVTRAKFVVSGAQGGNGGGRGAILETDTVTLLPGSELTAFVGGQGPVIQTTGAGGGGSALRWINAAGDTLYVIAGGGGGRDSQGSFYAGMHASLTENGNPGEQGWGGGQNGADGSNTIYSGWISGGGGGGFVSASQGDYYGTNAQGTAGSFGFGGGGGGTGNGNGNSGGGGGGYSGGGGGGTNLDGGGGGSRSDVPLLFSEADHTGHGTIEITFFFDPLPECILGCTNPLACNFNPAATGEDGSCDHCFCGPGTYWDEALGQCRVTNAADLNFDGCTTVADLVVLLSVFGQCSE